MFQFGLKELLLFKKLKTLCCGQMLLVILMEIKLLESFTNKNCQEQIKKMFRTEKVTKLQVINYMLNGKDMTIRLIDGQIKNRV